MPNPINFSCPANVWTKVATNITNAVIKKINVRPNVYLETYRVTADPAPADNTGANPIDVSGELIVNSIANIDVYIQPVGAAGEVRVDS